MNGDLNCPLFTPDRLYSETSVAL